MKILTTMIVFALMTAGCLNATRSLNATRHLENARPYPTAYKAAAEEDKMPYSMGTGNEEGLASTRFDPAFA